MNHYLRLNKVNFSHHLGNQLDVLRTYEEKSDFLFKHKVEIMVHPDYNNDGIIIDRIGTDEYDFNFISYLSSQIA